MIYEFLNENWQNLLITIIGGFIFFLAGILFLGYKERSAEFERYKKAKEIVSDVLESSLINKQPITLSRIRHIISAAEREQKTEIKDSPVSLLEDLELRFEISKHLDTEQQMVYVNQIEELMSNIESESKISSLPHSFEEIYISLKLNIENGNKDDALDDLNKISNKIKTLHSMSEPLIYSTMEFYKRNPVIFVLFIVIYIIVVYVFFISR